MNKTTTPQPRVMGVVNWIGVWTLYTKEVQRFMKVHTQTILAPMVTTLLYYTIFSLALGGAGRMVGDGMSFLTFLAPGLIMMSMVQNAFANSSSSIMISKYDGSIVDILMPPLSSNELAFGKVMGGVTRGLVVGVATFTAIALFMFPGCHSLFYIIFHGVLGSMMLALLGLIGGIWAEKFDHIAAMTNFVVMPLTFLSGTFYTIDRLPESWQFVAYYNPFFYMIDGFRYGFIGRADSDLGIGIAVMIVLNLALWAGCLRMLQTGYKIKS